jgi:putative protein-disulfide isomerase
VANVLAKSLIYVVDPMCSWCWGFSPVFEEIVRRYQAQVTVQVLLGGLRPGNTERFDEQRRAYILSHWHAVHERTGQPFNFAFQTGPSFTYDTEPPSRAVAVVRHLAPEDEFAFLKSVQEAFYVKNEDVTHEEILADLAGAQGIDRVKFLEWFQDPAIKRSVREEFDQARQLGVSEFPTMLGRNGHDLITFTFGYQPAGVLVPLIDEWLRRPPSGSSSRRYDINGEFV